MVCISRFANKKTEIVSCHTANSKLIKQEVNSTVILPPLVFPASVTITCCHGCLILSSVNQINQGEWYY